MTLYSTLLLVPIFFFIVLFCHIHELDFLYLTLTLQFKYFILIRSQLINCTSQFDTIFYKKKNTNKILIKHTSNWVIRTGTKWISLMFLHTCVAFIRLISYINKFVENSLSGGMFIHWQYNSSLSIDMVTGVVIKRLNLF